MSLKAMMGGKKKWLQGAVKHPGTLTAAAKQHGRTKLQEAEVESHAKDPHIRARGVLGKRFITHALGILLCVLLTRCATFHSRYPVGTKFDSVCDPACTLSSYPSAMRCEWFAVSPDGLRTSTTTGKRYRWVKHTGFLGYHTTKLEQVQ